MQASLITTLEIGYVWIDPDHEIGECWVRLDPCAYVIVLNHFSRAQEKPWKQRKLKPRVERKVAGSNIIEEISTLNLQSHNNNDFHVPILVGI